MKYHRKSCNQINMASHPARGAWIEIAWWGVRGVRHSVAPRKGCVD